MKYLKAVLVFLPLLGFSQRNELQLTTSLGLNEHYINPTAKTNSFDSNYKFHFNSDFQYQIDYSFQTLKDWNIFNGVFINYSQLNYYYKFYNPFGDLLELFSNHSGRMELGVGLKKRINIPKRPFSLDLGFNLIQRIYPKTKNYSTNGLIKIKDSPYDMERYGYDFSISYQKNFHANLFAQLNYSPFTQWNIFIRITKNTPIYYQTTGSFTNDVIINHPENNSIIFFQIHKDFIQHEDIDTEIKFIHLGIGASFKF